MMFKIRAVVVDYYLWKPTNDMFQENKDESQLEPVLRIFGNTIDGVKSCVHIHGVYPYMYVPYIGGEDQDRHALLLGAALDEALKGSSKWGNSRCVRDVSLVQATPLYGYHSQARQFFKVSFYNPHHVRQASELLLSGAILGKKFQPHEAHIPFVLQFMIDYNIYGMSFVTFSKIKYRHDPENAGLLTGVEKSDILPDKIQKATHSRLEVDAHAFDILNKNTGKVVDVNPGLRAFREEERNRMRRLSRTPSASLPGSPPRKPPGTSSSTEFIFKEKLFKKLQEIFSQRSKEHFQGVPAQSEENDVEIMHAGYENDLIPDMGNLMNGQILARTSASANLGTESESEEERTEADSILGRNHVEDEEEESENEDGEDLTQPLEQSEDSVPGRDAEPREQGKNIGENDKQFWNRMAENIFQVDGPQDSSSESDRDSNGKNSTESLPPEKKSKLKMNLAPAETWSCSSEPESESNWTNNIMALLGEDGTCLMPPCACQTPQTFWSDYSPKIDFWSSQSNDLWAFNRTDSAPSNAICSRRDADADLSLAAPTSNESFLNFSCACDEDRSNGDETKEGRIFTHPEGFSASSTRMVASPVADRLSDFNLIPASENVERTQKLFCSENSGVSPGEDFVKTKMVVVPRRVREPTGAGDEKKLIDVFESLKTSQLGNGNDCGEKKGKIVSLTLKQIIKDCGEIVNVDFKNLCERDMVIIEYKSLQSKDGQSRFLIKPLEKFLRHWAIAEKKLNEKLSEDSEQGKGMRKIEKSIPEDFSEKTFTLDQNSFQGENSSDGRKIAKAKSRGNKFLVKSLEILTDNRRTFEICDVNSYKINENVVSQGNLKMKLIKSDGDCLKSIKRKKIPIGNSPDREENKTELEMMGPAGISVAVTKKETLRNSRCFHKPIFRKEKEKKKKILTALDTKLIRQINSNFEKYFRNLVKVKNSRSRKVNASRSFSSSSEGEEKEEKHCRRAKASKTKLQEQVGSSFLEAGDFVSRLLASFSQMTQGSSSVQPLSITVTFGNSAASPPSSDQLNFEDEKILPKKKKPENKRRQVQNVDGAADSSSEDSESGDPKVESSNCPKKVKRGAFYRPLNVVLRSGSARKRKQGPKSGKEEEFASDTSDFIREDSTSVAREKSEKEKCNEPEKMSTAFEAGDDSCEKACALLGAEDFEKSEKIENFCEEKNEKSGKGCENWDFVDPNVKSEKHGRLEEPEVGFLEKYSLESSRPSAKILGSRAADDKLSPAAEATSFSTFSKQKCFSEVSSPRSPSEKISVPWNTSQESRGQDSSRSKGFAFASSSTSKSNEEFSRRFFGNCEAKEALENEEVSSDSVASAKGQLGEATEGYRFVDSSRFLAESSKTDNSAENVRKRNLLRVACSYFPKRRPPEKTQIFEFLRENQNFSSGPKMPFFGDPGDLSKTVESGPRFLKIRSDCITVLKSHKSGLEILGLEKRRNLRISEAQNKNAGNMRCCLATPRTLKILPLVKPPTFLEVSTWFHSKTKSKTEKRKRGKSKAIKCPFEFESDGNSSEAIGAGVTNEKSFADEAFGSSVDDIIWGGVPPSSSGGNGFPKDSPSKVKRIKKGSMPKALETVPEENDSSFCKRRAFGGCSENSFQIRGVTCDDTLGFPNSVENLNLSYSYQYVIQMVMEVHVQTRQEMLPDPRIDPVRALFYAVKFDDPARRQESGVVVVGEGLLSGVAVSRLSVHYVATERALFEKTIDLVRNWDPDILAGYEIEMNSWGYFVQRGFVLNLNLLVMLGRVRSEFSASKQASDFSKDVEDPDQVPKCVKNLRISGRIVLDIWRVLRHEVALKSYTFENVMYHLAHERHPLLSHERLSFYWEHPSQRFRHLVADHYSTRVTGVIKLLDQLDFVNRTSELSRLFGIQFYEVLSRGSQYRVESMMLRLAKPLNYIPVSPSVAQRAAMRAPASLPLIMEPESVFYSDPVIVLDFQSLYPSVIIAYNYCFSTCMGRVEKLGGREPFEFGCTRLQIFPEEIKQLQNDITISPAGVVFVKSNIRKGILPTMLEAILETRLMVKKSMKENKEDKMLQKLLFARQLGLKLIANVTYGYTAANFSGRMPCIEVGDSVVSKGRETLERAIKLIKTTSRWGAQVVYGDTDSIFVLTPGRSLEESFKIGAEIAEAVTQDNPKPVKLKLEKVYVPSILQTKKRYVGYMYESPEQKEPIFEAKGIETVRRDGCPATEKILRKALQILFDTKDISLVKKYTVRQFVKIYQGKVNLQDLIFAKEYRGRNGYRPGACVPALELAKQWTRRDVRAEPRTKERVPYVIANGPPGVPLIRLVRSPKDFAKDPSLRPNAEYYITKAVVPPLHRCLSLLGADVVSWYSEMPRKFHKEVKARLEEPRKKTTISQYFSAAECVACDNVTNALTCPECEANPQKVAVRLGDKIRRLERRLAGVTKICQSCCGRPNELGCISLDCPVMFRRNQIEKEVNQISGLRQLL